MVYSTSGTAIPTPAQDPAPALEQRLPRGAQDLAVQVESLVKRYGGVSVVDGLSFSIRRGEVFALLGPNGAGKTTTVEILEGYRVQDGGTVEVLGQNPRASRTLKQHIGIMPQQSALYPNILVMEALRLFCAYYGDRTTPRALIRRVNLEGKERARFKTLSGGEKQRLSLALVLAGEPELVFLDEPTAGMDPQARQTTWNVIKDLRARGVTVLLTTHYLEDAQRLADRVAIMEHGRLITVATPSELIGRTGGVVRFSAAPGLLVDEIAALPGIQSAREEHPGSYGVESADPDEALIDVAIWARARQLRVRDLRVERATLEEVFLQLTGEEQAS
jgi:ABC-2 type transport system ATP-binding protein